MTWNLLAVFGVFALVCTVGLCVAVLAYLTRRGGQKPRGFDVIRDATAPEGEESE